MSSYLLHGIRNAGNFSSFSRLLLQSCILGFCDDLLQHIAASECFIIASQEVFLPHARYNLLACLTTNAFSTFCFVPPFNTHQRRRFCRMNCIFSTYLADHLAARLRSFVNTHANIQNLKGIACHTFLFCTLLHYIYGNVPACLSTCFAAAACSTGSHIFNSASSKVVHHELRALDEFSGRIGFFEAVERLVYAAIS